MSFKSSQRVFKIFSAALKGQKNLLFMLKKFLDFTRKERLFSSNDNILLAVSGGVDSVVMCELFHRACFTFSIVHCNFSTQRKRIRW